MEVIKKERLLYIDYLRLMVIVLVVMVHLACTYSNIGGWYYYEKRDLDTLSTVVFGIFQSFTQAYFMGFMFLLAGFFVPAAYDKKGFKNFIKDRILRLGIPALIYMLVINPFIDYVILGKYYKINQAMFFKDYLQQLITLDFLNDSGPLWFALALLIFSLIYAVYKFFSKKEIQNNEQALPKISGIFMIIVMMGTISFLVRIIQPIGTDVMNMQLCFFTQYIFLFIIGIKAFRSSWLKQIKYKWSIKCMMIAVLSAPLVLLGLFVATGAATQGTSKFDEVVMGGFHLESLIYTLWESFVAIAMSVGLIGLFKEKFNKPHKLFQTLSDNGFAVYMFHAPIIIFVSYLFRDLNMSPLAKFLMMCIIDLPICFLTAHFILRKIPVLKKIL